MEEIKQPQMFHLSRTDDSQVNITEGLRGKATSTGASKKGEEGEEGAQIRKTQENIRKGVITQADSQRHTPGGGRPQR